MAIVSTDFHAHILPELDHGCFSVEEAKAQLLLAKNAGVGRIVASSHFYPDKHILSDFLEKRAVAIENILDYAKEIGIEIIPAAEVLLCVGLDMLDGVEKLCIGNSRSILLELPFGTISEQLFETAEEFIKKGYKIILAHADRYNKSYVNRMLSIGAEIQLNASALSSLVIKRCIKKYLSSGKVVALGSDIHRTDKGAYDRFLKAEMKLSHKANEIFRKSEEILNLKDSFVK